MDTSASLVVDRWGGCNPIVAQQVVVLVGSWPFYATVNTTHQTTPTIEFSACGPFAEGRIRLSMSKA